MVMLIVIAAKINNIIIVITSATKVIPALLLCALGTVVSVLRVSPANGAPTFVLLFHFLFSPFPFSFSMFTFLLFMTHFILIYILVKKFLYYICMTVFFSLTVICCQKYSKKEWE